jgi:acyl-CoA dehydrogenase
MPDIALPAGEDLAAFRERTRQFIERAVIPAESEVAGGEPSEELRVRLQQQARDAGVFAPHVSAELGGAGLDHRGQSVIFEAAGYSLLGPLALNCAAPDEGNTFLLDRLATPGQRVRWLEPLARGEIRSCFAMTEPAPGAGSDPSALRTVAERTHAGWRISGRKWLITGAEGAAFAICVARTDPDPGSKQPATLFIVPAGTPGYRVVRRIGTLDTATVGGHCEVLFEDCEIGEDGVLGDVGAALGHVQLRLAPARLTHCMRWLGVATRALDEALDFTSSREMFGRRLHDLGLAQGLIADSVVDIESSRALIYQVAALMDRGEDAKLASSVAKLHVSEATSRVVDRAVQLCGGAGVTYDTPVARFLAEIRAFRIYDGSSETHRWFIARQTSRRRLERRT